jgi:hypothetical protein
MGLGPLYLLLMDRDWYLKVTFWIWLFIKQSKLDESDSLRKLQHILNYPQECPRTIESREVLQSSVTQSSATAVLDTLLRDRDFIKSSVSLYIPHVIDE